MPKTKFNIVLDIDQTLVHTSDKTVDLELLSNLDDELRIHLRRKLYSMNFIDVIDKEDEYDFISSNYSGMYRPYLKEFLNFCFEYFENVIIWSAGKKKYVDKLCQFMFPLKNKPLLIYTYDDCIFEDDGVSKPLEKLYQDPKTKDMLNPNNTFHIDDRDDTYSENPNNGILIPEFFCDMELSTIANHEDNNLLKLMSWFSLPEVRKSKDIRLLNKEEIFSKSVEYYIKKLEK